MLRQSFVQILPRIDDGPTRKNFTSILAQEQVETSKNLCYVALTRAREQLILPYFEGFSDGSMLVYIEPLTAAQSSVPVRYVCRAIRNGMYAPKNKTRNRRRSKKKTRRKRKDKRKTKKRKTYKRKNRRTKYKR